MVKAGATKFHEPTRCSETRRRRPCPCGMAAPRVRRNRRARPERGRDLLARRAHRLCARARQGGLPGTGQQPARPVPGSRLCAICRYPLSAGAGDLEHREARLRHRAAASRLHLCGAGRPLHHRGRARPDRALRSRHVRFRRARLAGAGRQARLFRASGSRRRSTRRTASTISPSSRAPAIFAPSPERRAMAPWRAAWRSTPARLRARNSRSSAAFWIERPQPGANALVVHALLDSEAASGAYRFTLKPGDITIDRRRCHGVPARQDRPCRHGGAEFDVFFRRQRPEGRRRRPPGRAPIVRAADVERRRRMDLAPAAEPRDAADLGLRRQESARLRAPAAQSRRRAPSRTRAIATSASPASGSPRSATGATVRCSSSRSRAIRRSTTTSSPIGGPRSRSSRVGNITSPTARIWCWSPPDKPAAAPSRIRRAPGAGGGRNRRFVIDFEGDIFADSERMKTITPDGRR